MDQRKRKEIERETRKEIEKRKKETRYRLSPVAWIFLSFLLVVVLGWILLALPFSSTDMSRPLSAIDSLFLAVSCVCVTGLSTVVVAESVSLFGRIVMGVLIQIGGLGLVTVVSFWIFITDKQTSVSQAKIIKEALNQNGFAELKSLIYHILIMTFVFELTGMVMTMFVFVHEYDFWTALGYSVFHAVSAFNNAGFDCIGSTSLAAYKDNFLMNFATDFLIVTGSLGYLVYEDIFFRHKFKTATVQTKLVLIINLITYVVSILVIYLIGHNRMSFMQAVTYAINLRTAGFTTFDSNLETLSSANVIVSCVVMFIGGNPMSTAGGMKTVTVFVVFASMISYATGKKIVIFKRKVADETKLKAFFLVSLGTVDVILGTILICIFERNNQDIISLLESVHGGVGMIEAAVYEVVSAFCTVGFTLGITSYLSVGSKIVLCLLMFIGRVGPVAILTFWNPTLNRPKQDKVNYVDAQLMIG